MYDFNHNGKIDSSDNFIAYNMINDTDKAAHRAPRKQHIGLCGIAVAIVMAVSPIVCVVSLINPDWFTILEKCAVWMFTIIDIVILYFILKNKNKK